MGAVVLGDYKRLAEGQSCRCTSRILEVPAGIRPGTPTTGSTVKNIETKMTDAIEKIAPALSRDNRIASSDRPEGHRRGADWSEEGELIIGDRKTAIAVDAIINQKGTGIKCIYVASAKRPHPLHQWSAS